MIASPVSETWAQVAMEEWLPFSQEVMVCVGSGGRMVAILRGKHGIQVVKGRILVKG